MNIPTNIPVETIQLLSVDQAWYYHVVPTAFSNNQIEFFACQCHCENHHELAAIFDQRIEYNTIEHKELFELLTKYYRKSQFSDLVPGSSFINQGFNVEHLIQEAFELKSSDIHIDRHENTAVIRYRVDGKLLEKYAIPLNEYPSLINRIKIKSNLDISEKRLPQDGRIKIEIGFKTIDLRVSILPTMYGEKVVMRLLGKDSNSIEISKIGLNEDQKSELLKAIHQSFGLILISGPTGSGKTTTLYSLLKLLNQKDVNILTIEDPIEYTLDGINQVQLNEKIGLSFPKALRTFLRQDPDIIMVGEIRDEETAEMAVRASLTGHLVLSTIHTNSARDTSDRLINMGIPSYLIKSTLILSVAQRLVRNLCPNCKIQCSVEEIKDANEKFGLTLSNLFKSGFCSNCFFTGYSGRSAIFELVSFSEKENPQSKFKYKRLKESAIELLSKGETSLSEILPYL